MIAVKIEKLGESIALVLSDEAQAALQSGVGDTLYIDNSTGEIVLSKHPRSADERRERARAFRERYRQTFEALAK
ncbi:MAG: AbrB/MazE/SpoVT family DNA-binding protein [Caulobacter sp.]|jgi:hypothetical protein|nr:AbrB/MazE/SpoVT family DNA-binding protein [Caulobacter sp.]